MATKLKLYAVSALDHEQKTAFIGHAWGESPVCARNQVQMRYDTARMLQPWAYPIPASKLKWEIKISKATVEG